MSAPPKRVVFTGDVLRPRPDALKPAQNENIDWLARILRTPIGMAADLPCEIVNWDDRWELAARLDTGTVTAVYGACGLRPGIEAWARIHAAPALPRAVDEMLAPLFADSLVIGFELPPWLTGLCTRLGLSFIDCAISPLRFLDDLMFRLTPSDPAMADALAPWAVDEAAIRLAAGTVSGHVSRGFTDPPRPDSLLVVLQTPHDRVVIDEGRFIRLTDRLEALTEVARGYRHVLIRPHPLEPGAATLETVQAALPGARATRENVYRLIAHPNVAGVAALSSSCVAEAACFGKRGHYLMPGGAPAEGPGAVTVDHALLAPDLWRDLMAAAGIAVSPQDGLRLVAKPNRFRQQLRSAWGYNEIDTDIFVAWALR